MLITNLELSKVHRRSGRAQNAHAQQRSNVQGISMEYVILGELLPIKGCGGGGDASAQGIGTPTRILLSWIDHGVCMQGIKLELFIFDTFPLAERVALLEVHRHEEFAPVKNAPGSESDSPDAARQAMLKLHTRYCYAVNTTSCSPPQPGGATVWASASAAAIYAAITLTNKHARARPLQHNGALHSSMIRGTSTRFQASSRRLPWTEGPKAWQLKASFLGCARRPTAACALQAGEQGGRASPAAQGLRGAGDLPAGVLLWRGPALHLPRPHLPPGARRLPAGAPPPAMLTQHRAMPWRES